VLELPSLSRALLLLLSLLLPSLLLPTMLLFLLLLWRRWAF
jgi:hypothetical protein